MIGKNYKGSDERLTPRYGVEPIIKYVKALSKNYPAGAFTVWCPFDKEDSNFVIMLREAGFAVVATHIDNGQDFYSHPQPHHWDVMVSNPPFSNKKEIFKRALSFNKPIDLIMTLAWLNYSGSKLAFTDTKRDMKLLMFNQRMDFIKSCGGSPDIKEISFSSAYYCSNFLPRDIILENLDSYERI